MTHYGMVNNNASEATTVLTVQGPDGNSEDIILGIDTGDKNHDHTRQNVFRGAGTPRL